VEDLKAGEEFTRDNVRFMRSGHGLPVKDLARVLGRKAKFDLPKGTAMCWEFLG
jgi:pseudaminic acid synthase